jgi:hypothetical protein
VANDSDCRQLEGDRHVQPTRLDVDALGWILEVDAGKRGRVRQVVETPMIVVSRDGSRDDRTYAGPVDHEVGSAVLAST